MKTCKRLFAVVLTLVLLVTGSTGCQDYDKDIPAMNVSLSYPEGEMTLGSNSYASAAPTVQKNGDAVYAITRITHNGEEADLSLASINELGIILLTPGKEVEAVGEYLISVDMTVNEKTHHYPDALRVVVKGLKYEADQLGAKRGEEKSFEIVDTYLVQQKGSKFELVYPSDNEEYNHFTIDKNTATLKVDATAEAGFFPIDIRVVNASNPKGFVFKAVTTIVVESKPYGLKYEPNEVTLIPMEGHLSVTPSLRTASLKEGDKVTYSLVDDFAGVFTIQPETGVIHLKEDQQLVEGVVKTYKLQVKAQNDLGETSFPEAYTVNIDPAKKAEPITEIQYSDTFPVQLSAGQAWTSSRPSIIKGSTVGIKWALENAPQGVTIDEKTGIVTMAENHLMPLKMKDNKLTVTVKNQGMTTPFKVELGDFEIDPMLWKAIFKKNYSKDALTNSGFVNMERYSFSGVLVNNKNKLEGATSEEVKNGFGRSKGLMDSFDFNGLTFKNLNPSIAKTCQNNDWVVSSEMKVSSNEMLKTAVKFEYVSQFGKPEESILEFYVLEINAQNVYEETGDEMVDDKGMDAKPKNLPWELVATTNTTLPEGVILLPENHCTEGSGSKLPSWPTKAMEIDLNKWAGKSIRIAFRGWNPQEGSTEVSNARKYRISNLRVEQEFK